MCFGTLPAVYHSMTDPANTSAVPSRMSAKTRVLWLRGTSGLGLGKKPWPFVIR